MERSSVQFDLRALVRSDELRVLTDSIRDYAVFLLDRDGIVLTWNAGAQHLKGYLRDEIVGQSFTRFYREVDRAEHLPERLLAEAAREGRVEHEGWRVRKDGSHFWADVILSAIRDGSGALQGFVKVTRDLSERRRAEEQLRQSEERSRLTVESVKDYAIFMIDPQGRIATWNKGAERIKGYRPEEAIGRHISMFYTPEDAAAGRPARLLRAAELEGRVEDETWRVRKDGTRFWADVVLSRIDDHDGRLLGFTKVTRDLTQRRRIEEQLRESEERFRLLVDGVTDYAIFMLDPDGKVASWNAGAQRLKGYKAAEIIGEHFSRFYPPEARGSGKLEDELRTARDEGRFEEEGWRIRKDGSRFWASVVLTAIRNQDGHLLGFAKVTRDMTERKRAAAELERRARQQEALSELGLYAVRSPQLGDVAQRAVEIVRDLLDVEDAEIIEAGIVPPAASNQRIAVPIHAPEEEGTYGTLVVEVATPLPESDHVFLGAIANVVAAAAARMRMEQQLRQAERDAIEERGRTLQAEEALKDRDEFISVAAHELRTPLTALQLKLQGLERRLSLPDPMKMQRLDGAVRQIERLARLVDRLLDVTRAAQNRLDLMPESFDFAALLRQVAEDFRDPAAQAHSALTLEVPETVEGSWDRLRIEQVLVNLLSNAVKYGGGKPIHVRVDADGDRLRFSVSDGGIGIAPDDLGRIFNRFQRAASIRNYGGMGLGLYITRHIVEAHRGTISVVSKPGEGSTFTVDIPRFAIVEAAREAVPRARA